MRWAKRQRLDFIAERLKEPGFINRSDLMQAFEVGRAQAAVDLADFQRLNPGAMTYNTRSKRYEAAAQEDVA